MRKVFFVSVLLFLFSLALPSNTLADCDLASWDESTRDMNVCVGEFSSPAELRNTTVEFHCTGNSNFPYSSPCTGIQNPNFGLGSTPDSQIAQDANGLYYTCVTGQALNRAIGSLDVIFWNGGSQYCRLNAIYTRPDDWNPLTEGAPWNQGANQGSNPVASALGCRGDPNALDTAVGCIPIGEPDEFIAYVLRWAIGIGGGIAFLFILFAGFQIISSSGNPERLKAGQELMTSAIAGLVLLLFSVFILRFVGVDILGFTFFGS